MLRRAVPLLLALCFATLLVSAQAVAAPKPVFETSFSGAETPGGPFGIPVGVAADDSSGPSRGDVWVANMNILDILTGKPDEGSVVDKFDASGKYAGVQITPAAPGLLQPFTFFGKELNGEESIGGGFAVDSSGGPDSGDVYLGDMEHGVVDRFNEAGAYMGQLTGEATPAKFFEPSYLAVNPATGGLYVADKAHNVIDEFSPAGVYIGQISNSKLLCSGLEACLGPITVDSSGYVYAAANYAPTLEELQYEALVKLSPAGAVVWATKAPASVGSIAVDPDNSYIEAGSKPEGQSGQLFEYDTAGHLVVTTEGPSKPNGASQGIAFGLNGKMYAGESVSFFDGSPVAIFGTSTVPDVASGPADPTEKGATLTATAGPDTALHGGEVTSCQFEYGTTTSYGETVPCAQVTPYSKTESVSAKIESLTPDTEYHFRVSASDPGEGITAGGTNYSGDETFVTRGAAAIASEQGVGVTKSANLQAQIEAFGYETSCQVQYVVAEEFKVSGYEHATTTPCSPSELAAQFGSQHVWAHPTGLRFDSEYHYRFVVRNQSEVGTTYGADKTFTTFGIESFAFESVDQEGKPYTQAGGHPYEWKLRFAFKESEGRPDANMKDIVTELPAGFIGNATATPQCTAYASNHAECSGAAQVGVLTAEAVSGDGVIVNYVVPLFNMVPPPGVPAQLSANLKGFVNVLIDVNVRTGGDYGIVSIVHNSPPTELVKSVSLKLWGVPAEKSHDAERGCPEKTPGEVYESEYVFGCADSAAPVPFLVNPSSCAGPQTANLHIDTWSEPGEYADATDSEIPATTGCEHLSFEPRLTTQPENPIADSPSGLGVELTVPQNVSPEGLSSDTLRDAVVALPPGVSVSPSAAYGLVGCSPEEIGLDNAEPAHCPDTSKIGTVEIKTPLIYPTLKGDVYIAEQNNNPFDSMVAIYVAAEADGGRTKLAGNVELNPVTGQITTTFTNAPQIPFESFKLYFFGGPRGPLAMPISCGTFSSTSELTPWGAPESGPPADPGDFFTVDSGCTGGFAPKFVAGVTDPQAGAYTNFVLSFSREDGEGEPKGLNMSLPPGLLGEVGNVPLCSNADAVTGNCSADSQIGTVEAGAGPGSNPLFLPGKIYLTGPYNGGPYGTAVVVPAVAGPYNLGNVVVRQSIRVDPNDAHVEIVSDPFPTIVDGVPLRMRRVDVTLNRTQFMINPTSCEPMSVEGALTSVTGALANVESRFQLTNCAALGFKPLLALSTSAHASRENGASLDVTLTYPKGSLGSEANVGSIKVDLPKQLPSRLSTLQKACPDSTFNANPASCPPLSRIGTATATTPLMPVELSGPVYFVSHGGAKFPELIVVLSGDNITVDLRGETFISAAGITSSTFHDLPDVPIGQFHLTLPQGPDSALAANGNLCAAKLTMPTAFTAQDGTVLKQNTSISVSGCKSAITVLRHSVRGARATIVANVPAAGTLVASGLGFSRASARTSGPGAATLELTLSAGERAFLSHHPGRSLRTRVKLVFVPAHGQRLSTGVTVLLR